MKEKIKKIKNKVKNKIKNSKTNQKLEKIFEEGTYESFLLHDFLFLTNTGLTILMILELILIFGFDIEWHFFHKIDFFFGIVFLTEAVLRLYYDYLPNKIFFKPHQIISWIVIISLVWPNLFFNLAFLRIIRSLKIIKVYLYKKERNHELKHKDYDTIFEIIIIAFKSLWIFLRNKFIIFFKK